MTLAGEYRAVRAWLDGCRRPLIVTHRRPDGDALGAVAAMSRALAQLGLSPAAVLFEPLPARYYLLADMVPWRHWDKDGEELRREADAVVIVDTCSWSQLEPVADWLANAPRTLVIDHHSTRDPVATRPGDLRVFDETAAAVCLMVAEWIEVAGILLDPPLATALLVGMATDTGWFRFPSTDARLLRMAAQMVEAGAPPAPVHRYIHEQEPPEKLRLIGRMLTSMELLAGGRLVVLKLRRADFAATGADNAMTEDLVNEAGRLARSEVIVLFTEEADGRVRVNLRSKQAVDVSALASRFNGGGHARAAGARPQGSWDEVVTAVTAAILAELERPAAAMQ
ncbi:MAG: bifunctional oligoribonuclease/PAP phosphatase NrnA [Planctomycetota bacterium]